LSLAESSLGTAGNRTLTYEDLEHCSRLVKALSQTRALIAEIEATIPKWLIE